MAITIVIFGAGANNVFLSENLCSF